MTSAFVRRLSAVVAASVFLVACGSGDSADRSRQVGAGGWMTTSFAPTGGAEYYTVPDGVTELRITLAGGQGGSRTEAESSGREPGGRGGSVSARIRVTPGQVLTVEVGEMGDDVSGYESPFPDGGMGGYNGMPVHPLGTESGYPFQYPGSSGGGSSRIWVGDALVAVAGGGGGSGERSVGGAGGQVGEDASNWEGGNGGSATAGGAGGCVNLDFEGTKICAPAGGYLAGGSGDIAGSGGGGGYYGGGAGSAFFNAGSGGGGSSYVNAAFVSGDVEYTTGAREGGGVVEIAHFDAEYTEPPATTASTTLTTTLPPRAERPCRWGGPCQVGDIGPGGGTVFYNFTADEFGANAGPFLEVSNEVLRAEWCPTQKPGNPESTKWGRLLNVDDKRVAGGRNNHRSMIAQCTSGAANAVAAAKWGEMTDWWLPNVAELQLLATFWIAKWTRLLNSANPDDYARWEEWRKFPPKVCGWLTTSEQVDDMKMPVVFLGSGKVEDGYKTGSSNCVVGIRIFNYNDSSPLPMPMTATTAAMATTETTATAETAATAATTATTAATATTATTATAASNALTTSTTSTVAPSPGTTTASTVARIPSAEVAKLKEEDGIESPRVTVPTEFAIQLPTKTPTVAASVDVDDPQDPEYGTFGLVLAKSSGLTGQRFEVTIGIPKKPARSITHDLRLVGRSTPTNGSCKLTFTATKAKSYRLAVKCPKSAGGFEVLNPKKTYPLGYKLRLGVPALSGGARLEIRTNVKRDKKSPTSRLWRSKWLLAAASDG